MSQPTWADFVRWLSDQDGWRNCQESHQMVRAAHLVTTKNETRAVFAAAAGHGDDRFEDHVREWTASIGAAHADPPAVPREKLLALAEDLWKESDEAAEGGRAFVMESKALRSASSRLRAILDEPAALPKPERVEPWQRW